jgi:hypothetical protein
MSKQMISQRVKQTCDGCGESTETETIGVSEQEIVTEIQKWYVAGKKAMVDGQLVQLSVDACCLACVPAAAIKLALPKVEEPADNIDLGALRVGDLGAN